jgi:hypothetical protein
VIASRWRDRLVIPALVYLVIFFALNPHLASHFSTRYFFGGADGYQNIWNLWWVDQAIRTGQNPWFTTLLHHPYGTSLIGHTLNPFNGVIAMPLLTMGSLIQAYNAIVIFSFVSGGVTAAWLCHAMTGSNLASLVGGALFTFSSFHFQHADGHLQLTALQWVPLFVLCWIRFCERPATSRGVTAAAVLMLVILCDLYYFAYCVFAAALFYGYTAWRKRDWRFVTRDGGVMPLVWTAVAVMATCGVLAGALIYQHATDPLFGTHSPRLLSMDLLSPFVWGSYWRFRDSVAALWQPLSPYPTETSVHLGLSVIALSWYGWRRRRRESVGHAGYWALVVAFFGVMSLGPNLRIGGHELSIGSPIRFMGHDNVNWLALPYVWLWVAFPPWRLAGVPVRMMVMVQLAVAVLAAGGVRAILQSGRSWRYWVLTAVLAIATIEYLPVPLRVSDPAVPRYVNKLAELPDGAVLDLAANAPLALYYQTIHRKPMAFGYISRTATSVDQLDQQLAALILSGDWEAVTRRYGFRYVVKGDRAADVMIRGLNEAGLRPIDPARQIYSAGSIAIYEF